MSDVVHLLEGFRWEGDIQRGSVASVDLISMKEEKQRLEKNFFELESRATELSKANLAFFFTQGYMLRFL